MCFSVPSGFSFFEVVGGDLPDRMLQRCAETKVQQVDRASR
jgi:hypothetical protein